MARTFTYDKRKRQRQAPPLQASWRQIPNDRQQRRTFAILAERVRQVQKNATTQATDPTDPTT